MHTRSLMLGALATLLAAPSAWTQTRELGSSGVLLDGIAAVVDSGVVLKSELEERLELVMNSLRQQQAALPPLSALERQVLDQLIIREILLQRAARMGIVVGEDELNQFMAQVAGDLGVPFEQLPATLAQEGFDYAAYRQDIREEIILDRLEQSDVLNRINITPREMEQCLRRLEVTQAQSFDYHVSHILIAVSSGASQDQVAEARRQAEEIHARLEAGEDFAQLALQYSGAQTALDGGSLGWLQGSQLPTLFADRVLRMEPGEFTEPMQNPGGFHLVQLNQMRGAAPVMVDQARVRHILIIPNELMDDDAVYQRLVGIRQQILDGDDFAAHAQAVSEDPGSAADGGDLGWVAPGTFLPEFEEVLATLELGELSEPFQTRSGWHVAEITGRREHDTTDEMKREECRRQIAASKAQEEREIWLRRLRDQAYVDVRI